MKPKDPANPLPGAGYPGHCKRDDIAIRAMLVLLQSDPHFPITSLAKTSYQIADAMIKESEKE